MNQEFGISKCKLLYICIAELLCCTPETNKNTVNQLYLNKFFKIFLKRKKSKSLIKEKKKKNVNVHHKMDIYLK